MRHLRKLATATLLLIGGLPTLPAAAHEFWLQPDNFTPAPGDDVEIYHFNGQNFSGDDLPFLGEWNRRYVVADAKGERSVRGYDGDLPAVTTRFDSPGLRIFAYHGSPDILAFETLDTFETYIRKVGLGAIVRRHREQGKPETNIRESYTRNAKLLLGVGAAKGGAAGADRALGLPLELIAEQNPYTTEPGATLPVRLLYKGEPMAGLTITTFNDRDPKNPSQTVTDAAGRALIALPTTGAYLVSAVHMFEPSPGTDADWESLWVSLTFSLQ